MTKRLQRFIRLQENGSIILLLDEDTNDYFGIRYHPNRGATYLAISVKGERWTSMDLDLIISLEKEHLVLMEIWTKYGWIIEGSAQLREVLDGTIHYPLIETTESFW